MSVEIPRVMETQPVTIQMDLSCARVIAALVEMDLIVQVCISRISREAFLALICTKLFKLIEKACALSVYIYMKHA